MTGELGSTVEVGAAVGMDVDVGGTGVRVAVGLVGGTLHPATSKMRNVVQIAREDNLGLLILISANGFVPLGATSAVPVVSEGQYSGYAGATCPSSDR